MHKPWKGLCIERFSETNRLRKIVNKQSSIPERIQKSDGTLFIWMGLQYNPIQINAVNIDTDRLHWEIKSFHNYKFPGPECIISADVQNKLDLVTQRLLSIYQVCLSWSYIPDQWTKCNVMWQLMGNSIHRNTRI